jgi:phosphohistidine swiveling domain-containing protein
MTGDDPCHTDWMLSAGLPLDGWYGEAGEDLRDCAFALAGRLLKSMTGRDAMVLSGSGSMAGPIRHDPATARDGDVLVLRSADARYLDAVMRACGQGRGGVIVERGGALAHLVQVSRTQNIHIVRLEDARRRLPEGHTAVIDCAAGTVRLDP